MTTTVPAPSTGNRVLTPTPRRVARRALFWVGVAAVITVIGVISIGVAGTSAAGVALSASNPAPIGAMAVAEVLKQQGVTVIETSSLVETAKAVTDRTDTTLFIYDAQLMLDADQLRQAVGLTNRVVLANASFDELSSVAPALAQAGLVTGQLTADCDVPEVQRAGTVTGGPSGYRVVGDSSGVSECLGSGDHVYSLVQFDGGRLSVLGATDALTNEHVAEKGNAALALGLLGHTRTLVWYLPSSADLPTDAAADPSALSPGWVIPVQVLLVLTFIAAAIWRGRRFGPLVVENLPVTVRSSETMLGRARLYERSSSRLRAVDSLRIGALGRLGAACGLPRVATVDEIVAAVAAVTGAQLGEIRALLVDDVPTTDAELLRLSDALLTLERDVAHALRH